MLILSGDTQCEALTISPTAVTRDLELPHEDPGPSEAQLEIKDIAKQSS